MLLDVFQSTKNWTYSQSDTLAETSLSALAEQARKDLPTGFFDRKAPLSLPYMRETQLYHALKTMPKGVLHNVFLDCCEDVDFFRNVVSKEENLYVTKDFRSFRIGTTEEAAKNSWLSMKKAREQFKSQEEFVKQLSGVTLFTEAEVSQVCKEEVPGWQILSRKMSNSATLLHASHLFPIYIKHVLRKFIANGYLRVQFRAELVRLSRYDTKGKFVEKLPYSEYTRLFDEAFAEISKKFPFFSVGVIFCIKKSKTQEDIETSLRNIFALNWSKTVGIDFIQEEQLYGGIEKYDAIVNKVLKKYPDSNIEKVYHAGETKDYQSRNIEEAVLAGSVRIGHGLNIMQRIEFLPYCKYVCFEKCPMSNLLLGYTGDPRESSAPILLGLGYAVSINIGDAGKLGVQDSTADFFITMVSYDWTLKHIKLVALHSINHSLTNSKEQRALLQAFEQQWDNWVGEFIAGVHQSPAKQRKELDIYTSTNNWQFSQEDEEANRRFEKVRMREFSHLPKTFYAKNTMAHLEHMRTSEMYKILKTIPKGVLHHDHLDCNEDQEFYLEHVMSDPIVYLAADKKSFKIGTKQQAEKQGWVSFEQLKHQIPNQKKRVKLVSNLTMLSKEELAVVAGVQHDFWVIFQEKISNFFPIVFTLHLFKKYVRHTLLKFIKNGYERVQFRALLCQLTEYDSEGNLVKVHDEGQYMRAFDEVYFQVIKQYPYFSAAFIFFGLKALSQEANFNILDKACSYGWERHIGIDFVQQQDPFGSMQPYVRVGDRIVAKYPHMNLKKAYHAGETKDHLNNNIELSVRSGAVRIGHGLNIFKRIDYLNQCKNICFELNPISNLLTGGMADIRMSPGPILLGLGYPVSISSDDPGKFGYQDTTVDYFAATICFNWTLKHLKLIAYHSINHAIVTEGERIKILDSFNKHWKEWVSAYLKRQENEGIRNVRLERTEDAYLRQLSARINTLQRP